MRALSVVVTIGLIFAPAASADGVTVTSNAPADVFLDGNQVGATPVTLGKLAPGGHAVRVVERSTSKAQIYTIEALPTDRQGQIAVEFKPGQPKEMVISEAPVAQVKQSAPKRVSRNYRRHSHDNGYHVHRHRPNYKSRVRNVSAGVTGLGLITGSGFLTGMGLGGVIANESRP